MSIDPPGRDGDDNYRDGEIVARVRRGDSDAFERLVRRHLRAAHSVAFSVLGQDCDADDACQEAFMTALERIDQCRDPNQFRGWLLAIVRNKALGLLRGADRRRAVRLESSPLRDPAANPDTSAFWSEAQSEIGKVLSTLTELQRRVLLLHDLEGWKHGEISEQLGISSGSSRVHLHLARRSVRSALGHRYTEGFS